MSSVRIGCPHGACGRRPGSCADVWPCVGPRRAFAPALCAEDRRVSGYGAVGGQNLARAPISNLGCVLELLWLLLTTVLAWARPRHALVLENLLLRHQLAV